MENMDEFSVQNNTGVIGHFSTISGIPEWQIRYIGSLLAGYPLAAIYRNYIHGSPANIQHIFFIICGLALGYFNFGFDISYTICAICLTYGVLLLCGGTKVSVGLAFFINLFYLIVDQLGYSSDLTGVEYTLDWRTPQCVLALRLIGVVFDVYDGKRDADKLSADQKETALHKCPNLLEISGQTFFFGGFLAGPVFPMRRYLDCVHGKYSNPVTGGPPDSISAGLKRFALGLLFLVLCQCGNMYMPDSYLLTTDFVELPLLMKCLTVLVWHKCMLSKYLAVWLLTEGSCILTGMSYNGKDENNKDLWDGCSNMDVQLFLICAVPSEFVRSFNIRTNNWVSKYVFKRLRFLGNKNLSKFMALMFLAFWHGSYSGYYAAFFLQFIGFEFHTQMEIIVTGLGLTKTLHSIPGGIYFTRISKALWLHFALGYGLMAFALLTYDQYLPLFRSMYFFPHLVMMLPFPFYSYIKRRIAGKQDQNHVYPVANGSKTD